jgi:hypothetical protein
LVNRPRHALILRNGFRPPQDEMLCVVAKLPFFMVRSAPEGRVSNHEGLI